jgi:Fe-S cluster assembly protein SufD
MKSRPTDAETALSNLFETRRAAFTERPLDAARAAAFARFAEAGLPHRRVEAYRYTDLRARLRALPPASGIVATDAVAAALAAEPPLDPRAARIVLANGRFVPALSAVPAGASVADILDPAAEAGGVGGLVADSDDPLTLAAVALFDGGAILSFDGTVESAVEIVHVVAEPLLVMPRLAVFIAPGATVRVVERTVGGAGAVVNALVELSLGEGARVDWVRLAEGVGGTDLHSLHVRLAPRAHLEHLLVSTGTGLSRAQVFANVAGDDAEANLRAATIAVGERHADTTAVVRHDALGSRSSEMFRSAVGHGGTAIVQGRIFVERGAQKTDARMMSNALFLDETAEVVNKPELEIFADDVQCGHGATAGDLDEEMVFYLRARGIPEAEARRLLVEAFLLEALANVADETLREALAARLGAALDAIAGTPRTDGKAPAGRVGAHGSAERSPGRRHVTEAEAGERAWS